MPIQSTFVAATALNNAVQSGLAAIPDMTDVPVEVGLITVSFVESAGIDESTIPISANFAAKTSGVPVGEIDETGRVALVFPDPVGGWDFPSIGTGFPVTVYGYRVNADDGTFMGCRQITPQTVTAVSQHVVLPTVALRPPAVAFLAPGDPS